MSNEDLLRLIDRGTHLFNAGADSPLSGMELNQITKILHDEGYLAPWETNDEECAECQD